MARKYKPDEVLNIIRQTARESKRVPSKREIKKISDACVWLFGSWNNAVTLAGLRPNRSHSQRMYRRVNAKALDGHLCDSISEAIVDNWFTKNKIFHTRNIPYPGTRHRADWGVGEEDTFVEYFGLAEDSPRYDRSIEKKRELCHENKIKLIEIYAKDLYPKICLNDKFKQIMQR